MIIKHKKIGMKFAVFTASLWVGTIHATVPVYTEVINGLPPSLVSGAGLLDITNLPAAALSGGVVNAIPNDTIDDAPAIKAAIKYALNDRANYDRNNAPSIIYIPNGTYVIGSEIQSRLDDGTPNSWSDGWRRSMYLQGQSRAGTILKLKNSLAGYQDIAAPRSVIKTGSEGDSSTNEAGGGNRAFDHSVMNMTIDTGSGNPGAMGIDYVCNNTGTIEDVIIRSSDANKIGICGLNMTRNWPGPALIKNVEIDGFNHAVRMAHYVYSMTFEHLSIKNQKVKCITTSDNNLFIRGLKSVNTVPVFESTASGSLTLIDADLSGGLSTNTALTLKAASLLRNVTSAGYGTIINNTVTSAGSQKAPNVTGGASAITVAEYSTHGRQQLWSQGTKTIGLTIKDTPEYFTTDTNKYLSVTSTQLTNPATPHNSGNDDALGIQQAIDQAATLGKEIVYLPNGVYHIASTIVVRGAVKKIIGSKAAIWLKSGFSGDAIRFDGGTSSAVVIEFLNLGGRVVHNSSSKTLSLRHITLDRYTNTAMGTGDVFLEDVNGRQFLFDHPQRAWCRQLNPEFTSPAVRNNGGKIWILGVKSEGGTPVTLIESTGGYVELLGSYYEASHAQTSQPFIKLTNTEFTGHISQGGDKFRVLVEETRAGVVRRMWYPGEAAASLGANDIKALSYKTVPLFIARTTDNPPTLMPLADTFVRDGSYAGTNYGTNVLLSIKNDGINTGYVREAFIKFSLSGQSASSTYKLILPTVFVGTTAPTHALILSATSWTETGLTWNNRPATSGSNLYTWVPVNASDIELNVSTQVQNAINAAQSEISFKVYSPSNHGANGGCDYGSKENTNSILRSRLEIN